MDPALQATAQAVYHLAWTKKQRMPITMSRVDEGRKRVLLIAASILAARKLAQHDGGARVPATVSAIADAVRWAERIMEEIDRRHPTKQAQERRVT